MALNTVHSSVSIQFKGCFLQSKIPQENKCAPKGYNIHFFIILEENKMKGMGFFCHMLHITRLKEVLPLPLPSLS